MNTKKDKEKSKNAEYYAHKLKAKALNIEIKKIIDDKLSTVAEHKHTKLYYDLRIDVTFKRSTDSVNSLHGLIKYIINDSGYLLNKIDCRKGAEEKYGLSQTQKNWTSRLSNEAINFANGQISKNPDLQLKEIEKLNFSTLNELVKLLKRELIEDSNKTHRPKIVISNYEVFINDDAFKIFQNKLSSGKSYRYLRINVDKFEKALEGSFKKSKVPRKKVADSNLKCNT
jgi:hypothetical protein